MFCPQHLEYKIPNTTDAIIAIPPNTIPVIPNFFDNWSEFGVCVVGGGGDDIDVGVHIAKGSKSLTTIYLLLFPIYIKSVEFIRVSPVNPY